MKIYNATIKSHGHNYSIIESISNNILDKHRIQLIVQKIFVDR